jgi:hypothetical protein
MTYGGIGGKNGRSLRRVEEEVEEQAGQVVME